MTNIVKKHNLKFAVEIDVEQFDEPHFQGLVVTTRINESNSSPIVFLKKYELSDSMLGTALNPELVVDDSITYATHYALKAYLKHRRTGSKE